MPPPQKKPNLLLVSSERKNSERPNAPEGKAGLPRGCWQRPLPGERRAGLSGVGHLPGRDGKDTWRGEKRTRSVRAQPGKKRLTGHARVCVGHWKGCPPALAFIGLSPRPAH